MTQEAKRRMTALVTGKVQGVGYRAFVRRFALDNEITGYAENLDDGRVEVVAEGYKEALELLLHQLKRGPTLAVIDEVSVSWGDTVNVTDFHTY